MQQPPLSRQIGLMEREMNVQLFRRLSRGVELTSAGQALFREAKAILVHCDRALETTLRAARGEQGSLCIGVSPTSSFNPLVPDAICSFREKFPGVSVTLEECLTAEIIQRLQSEQMDVAFFRPESAPPKDLEVKLLMTERMVVALPRGHALARRSGSLAMKDLINEAFIVFARQGAPTFYEATIAACLRAGFSARIWSGGAACYVGAASRCSGTGYLYRARLHGAHGHGWRDVPRAQVCGTAEGEPQARQAPLGPVPRGAKLLNSCQPACRAVQNTVATAALKRR